MIDFELGKTDQHFNILDVATGTGALPITALECYPNKNFEFLATDFSAKMVEIVERRTKELNVSNITAKVMDGQVRS